MENSKVLIAYAIKALNEANISPENWRVGGGNALAQYYYHRQSRIVEIYLDNDTLLKKLSPVFSKPEDIILDCHETDKAISLTYPEGTITYSVSPQLTHFSPYKSDFWGEEVLMDDAVEIVIKKIYYRGYQLLHRDVFDTAVVFASARKADLIDELKKIPDKAEVFCKKITYARFDLYSETFDDMLLYGGRPYKGQELDICKRLVKALEK